MRVLFVLVTIVVFFVGVLNSFMFNSSFVTPGLDRASNALSLMDQHFLDFRENLVRPNADREIDIVLIAYDDDLVDNFRAQLQSRSLDAEVLKKIAPYKPKTVAMDILFLGEKEGTESLVGAINELHSIGSNVILGFTVGTEKVSENGKIDPLMGLILDTKEKEQTKTLENFDTNNLAVPVFSLQRSGAVLAGVSNSKRSSSKERYGKLIYRSAGLYFPSIALWSVASYLGKTPQVMALESNDLHVQLDGKRMEFDLEGEYLIRYFGDHSKFPVISAADILNDKISEDQLRNTIENKLVFVGSTSKKIYDHFNTAVSPELPGVLVHMNSARNILRGHLYKEQSSRINSSIVYNLFFLLILAMGLYRLQKAWTKFFYFFIFTGAFFLADLFYFLPNGHRLPLATFLLGFLVVYLFSRWLPRRGDLG